MNAEYFSSYIFFQDEAKQMETNELIRQVKAHEKECNCAYCAELRKREHNESLVLPKRQQDITELYQALLNYSRHDLSCDKVRWGTEVCTCGLDGVIERYK